MQPKMMTSILRQSIKQTKANSLNSIVLPIVLLRGINHIVTVKQKKTPRYKLWPEMTWEACEFQPSCVFYFLCHT